MSVAPIPGKNLVSYTDQTITIQELLHWELQVLASCKWQLGVPTTISFLHQLVPRLTSLSSVPPHLRATLTRAATTIATLAATEYTLLQTPRSVIAAASLKVAFNSLSFINSDEMANELSAVMGCPLDSLTRSAITLKSLHLRKMNEQMPETGANNGQKDGSMEQEISKRERCTTPKLEDGKEEEGGTKGELKLTSTVAKKQNTQYFCSENLD